MSFVPGDHQAETRASPQRSQKRVRLAIIDRDQVSVGEVSLDLTAREFEILNLLDQSDRVLRREGIYERVWGYAMAHGDRSVDVFVRKLRQKLRTASPDWNYIHTHFGVGYRFAPQPEDVSKTATPGVGEPAGDELDPALIARPRRALAAGDGDGSVVVTGCS